MNMHVHTDLIRMHMIWCRQSSIYCTDFLMASASASMKGPKSASVSVSRLCHGILHACPKGLWCQHSSLFLQFFMENSAFCCFDLLVLYADTLEQHRLAVHLQLNRFTGASKAFSLKLNHIKHKQKHMAACCNSDLVDMQYSAVLILTALIAVIIIFVFSESKSWCTSNSSTSMTSV